MHVIAFVDQLSCGSNERFAHKGTWTERSLVRAGNQTLPAVISLTDPATVGSDGCRSSIGHTGPGVQRNLPRRPPEFIMSRGGNQGSKAVQFSSWIFSTSSSPPKNSAPGLPVRSLTLSPEAMPARLWTCHGPGFRTTGREPSGLRALGRPRGAWEDRRSRRTSHTLLLQAWNCRPTTDIDTGGASTQRTHLH